MKAHEALIVLEGVILNELFAYREKDHKGLNKYFIPSKLSLKAASNPVSM